MVKQNASSGMESLIPIINELQEVFSATGTAAIKLPQIVVVGAQSSGKSSVLESLVGKSFLPRGSGLVTRCPTILQLIHKPLLNNNFLNGNVESGPINSSPKPKKAKKASGSPGVVPGCTEWCVFHHSPDKIYTDFDEVREEINRQTDVIAGTNSNIVKVPIQLTVYSPNVVTLTVVDLPGIVKVPTGDQPEDIEKQISDLIHEYIQNPNAIILAVSAANNDLATSESIKYAQDADPQGDRTLAIITKLDLMDQGTDATNVLTGTVIPVKLGIIGVVNRSQKAIQENKSVEDALRDEAEFLSKNYPLLANKNGTRYLATRLNQILMNHIEKCLPDLELRIRDLTLDSEATLNMLGGADLSKDKSSTMLDLIGRFCCQFNASIFGNSRQLETKKLGGGAKIREICQTTINSSLSGLKGCQKTDKEILIAIQNSKGFESGLDPQDAFQSLVKEQVVQMKKPAIDAANLVHKELKHIVHQCITADIQRFPKFRTSIVAVVNEIWNNTFKEFRAELEKYILMEASYVNTDHDEFVQQYAELQKQLTGEELGVNFNAQISHAFRPNFLKPNSPEHLQANVKRARELIKIYFNIVIRNLDDHFRKSLAYHIVYYATEALRNELTKRLYTPDKVEELIQESEGNEQLRKETVNMLKALERATEIIEKTRTTVA